MDCSDWDGAEYERLRQRRGSGTKAKGRKMPRKETKQMGKFTDIPGKQIPDESSPNGGLSDPAFERDFPAIWEFMTLTVDEGARRETSTLLLFVQDGRMTICLNDRQRGRSVFQSAPTLREAMVCLDEALTSGSAEWRYRQAAGRTASRKSA